MRNGETITEQDAALLGRKTYEEWSDYWPQSKNRTVGDPIQLNLQSPQTAVVGGR